ncbi:PD-(D/E)XK nuclease family protein (plasmid) [Sphingobium yanoikuyae]|jgi:PD-(D/E)XK nuclease superfamily|uniref:PD-(D/E)XK nuclease family protein n=1 Tax=Sphingobium yanoikuyae TaxID=13690 RepID=A0A6M4GEN9_SPHYA|nr:PD-(D/E)XK nuclease family protein [Sphingobium yanoikuyae]QJR05691.1 PD-(D/E)XK nuclease family protein [Sphingobium yanoikuyae]
MINIKLFYDNNQPAIDFLLDNFAKWQPDSIASAAPDGALAALAGDPAFQAIAAATVRPNMFVATGNMTRESHHSNFLAWLLSPRENHGFGTDILRTLFPIFEHSRAEDIVVLREHVADLFEDEETAEKASGPRGSRPDVLVYDPVARAIAVIEVKFAAKEGDRQLERYFTWATRHFASYHGDARGWEQQLVFLTRRIPEAANCDSTGDSLVVTNLVYETLSKQLAPFAHSGAAGASAVQDYIDFLALHACPLESIHSKGATSLVVEHEPVLRALHRRRHALRREALGALAPDLAALGWVIDAAALATNTTKVRLQYLPADRDSSCWHAECGELEWGMGVFVNGPPALTGELRAASSARRAQWVTRLGQVVSNSDHKKRVLTVKLALPAQQRPFPLTTHTLPMLVDHLRVRLRTQVAEHVQRIRTDRPH